MTSRSLRVTFLLPPGVALSALLSSCSMGQTPSLRAEGAPADTPRSEDRRALGLLSPLPALPADPSNAVADDARARELGRRWFFDAGFSGPLRVASDLGAAGEVGKVSCASCHSGPALDDRRSDPPTVSMGADLHGRNSPPLVNSAYYRWTNWGGRFSAQWELSPVVAESPVLLNSSRLFIAHRIFDRYRAPYEAVFGPLLPAIGADRVRFPAEGKPKPAPTAANPTPPDGVWEGLSETDRNSVNRVFVNYGKALAAYVRSLVSTSSPFDRFVAGEDDAIGEAAKRGAATFVGKAGCVACHSTPLFSDDGFHNLGVPQLGPGVPASDDGRFRDVPPLLASGLSSSSVYSDDPNTGRLSGLSQPMPESARGAFRTPTLRNVAITAPYMHSGQLPSLRAVVDFYDQGGGTPSSGTLDPLLHPLGLSAAEKEELVLFLETLTLDPLSAELLAAPEADE
jgi:cytochrome c peroxidase